MAAEFDTHVLSIVCLVLMRCLAAEITCAHQRRAKAFCKPAAFKMRDASSGQARLQIGARRKRVRIYASITTRRCVVLA